LKWLDIGGSQLQAADAFKMKTFEKLLDPKWPDFIQFLGEENIEYLNMQYCWSLTKNNFELFTTAIGNKPYPCKSLRVLNLS
jgi:hypothetical protein